MGQNSLLNKNKGYEFNRNMNSYPFILSCFTTLQKRNVSVMEMNFGSQ